MWSWLAHALGLHEGVGYNIFSGVLPDVTLLGALGVWWRKHTCHVDGCSKFGHPVYQTGYRACHKHHPDVSHPGGERVTAAHILTARRTHEH